ncbi:MAG: TIGR01777 family oxidoreductase, partial [Desulfobaccales bacterium]
MKVFMTGGTGFVGAYLSRELVKLGHEVTILSRREQPPDTQAPGIRLITGDPAEEGDWMEAAPESDWIINLAGASVFGRWSPAYKQEIVESRIRTTRNLVIALAGGDRRQLFCSTSAVGYYGLRGDEVLTEESPPDSDFLARLGVDWEVEALKARELGLRVVITRFGIVLGKGGGALGQMAPMFRRFLGGPLGSGQQWFSWIHQGDLARAFSFVAEHPEIDGPVNFTAPNPVRNRDLAGALGRALRRP